MGDWDVASGIGARPPKAVQSHTRFQTWRQFDRSVTRASVVDRCGKRSFGDRVLQSATWRLESPSLSPKRCDRTRTPKPGGSSIAP
jgi:hypothetical protein